MSFRCDFRCWFIHRRPYGLQFGLRLPLYQPTGTPCDISIPQPCFAVRLGSHVPTLRNEQSEHDFSVQDPTSHITNTGRIIEDMEIKMRGLLQEVSHSFSFLSFRLFARRSPLFCGCPFPRTTPASISRFTFLRCFGRHAAPRACR